MEVHYYVDNGFNHTAADRAMRYAYIGNVGASPGQQQPTYSSLFELSAFHSLVVGIRDTYSFFLYETAVLDKLRNRKSWNKLLWSFMAVAITGIHPVSEKKTPFSLAAATYNHISNNRSIYKSNTSPLLFFIC